MSEDIVSQLTDSVRYKYDPSRRVNQTFAQSDRGILGARLVNPGGQTPFATRESVDVFCMVKKGHARIIGLDGELIAELGQSDGIVIPSGTAYAIEVPPDAVEPAELLEFHASQEPLVQAYQPFSE